ncbi:hypothetical protein NA78x_001093 [Anatilimnocola sp. NA78]|uniref:hypothetical protein n=1 Tax=Anatilimnocola sp. NA78 TaxID=3415683 RepID=UPI003CE58A6B
MDHPEHEQPLNDDLLSLERSLRQLQPLACRVDRDRLMFLAGQAAAAPVVEPATLVVPSSRTWLWPAATAAMTAVSACLLVALSLQMSRPSAAPIMAGEKPAPIVQPDRTVVQAPLTKPMNPAPVVPRLLPPSSISLSLPAGSVLRMRDVALRLGVDALPAGNSPQDSADTSPEISGPWLQLRDANSDPTHSAL